MGVQWNEKYALRRKTGVHVRERKRKSVKYQPERGNIWSVPLSRLNVQGVIDVMKKEGSIFRQSQ